MTPLLEAASLSQAALAGFFLVFLRVGGTMLVLPAFGEASVPRRIRLGLAVGFTLIVAPGSGSLVAALLTVPVSTYFAARCAKTGAASGASRIAATNV